MKFILIVIGTMLALSACGAPPDDYTDVNAPPKQVEKLEVTYVTLQDGRKIPCIAYRNNLQVGGVTCDWSVP